MSAMVTQLSFNINEKLRLDETPFTSYNKVLLLIKSEIHSLNLNNCLSYCKLKFIRFI